MTDVDGAIRSTADLLRVALVHHELGRAAAALVLYRLILIHEPANAHILQLMGMALASLQRGAVAIAWIEKAIRLHPQVPEFYGNLGNAYQDSGQFQMAIAQFRTALSLRQDYVETHYNLGNAWRELGQLDVAIDCFRKAILLLPSLAEAYNNLGLALKDRGRLGEAERPIRRALLLRPNFINAHYNLGIVFQEQGRLDEAIAAGTVAAELSPGLAPAQMALAFLHLYRAGVDLPEVLQRARAFAKDFAVPISNAAPPLPRRIDESRVRPRLGIVSADLRQHAVGLLACPGLEALAADGFEIVFYSNSPMRDALTDRLERSAWRWRMVAGQSDAALRAQIIDDEVDVLLDLSGYSGGNRWEMLAARAAPLQVGWIGYPATTGLPTIDYLIADRYQWPDEFDAYYSEKPIRLPDSYICFEPMDGAPEVTALPCQKGRPPVFGSFNALKKMTPAVIALWSTILHDHAGSELLIKTNAVKCPETQQRVRNLFAEHGIAAGRLRFVGGTTPIEHLRWMQTVDIALDPFPYSGGQTTLECLWMGLPVITWPGRCFSSRHSYGYLCNIGAENWVVGSTEEYRAIVTSLLANRDELARLRADLRRRIQAARFADRRQFAEDLGRALITIWARFRHGESVTALDID